MKEDTKLCPFVEEISEDSSEVVFEEHKELKKKPSRNILLIIGGIIGFVFILGIILNFVTGSMQIEKSSHDYVDKIVPLIVTSWDYNELLSRANPELLKAVPPEKFKHMFKIFSEKLGHMKEYKGSTGNFNTTFSTNGNVTTAVFMADAVFEKSPAKIKITLVKHNDTWQILGFYVVSNALI